VQVSCKLQAFSLDSIGPDGYWYEQATRCHPGPFPIL
jgi:hypothetical protein